ncbi:hypothetical protein [Ornithinibacillus halotolerans]|uniref:EVE domain-containing protein n=1 Tax=Ornithinibacillus halotolerans TaxID=1274357 RepID=A0A916SBB5_9BACI|nr:hypothetical protein [Ornithinibacillus halotolerans]GGA91747.1 hypothetical protein GCM10008025_37800 [Ornithinibacillus halotolerans]
MRKAYIINTNLTNRPGGETEVDMLENEKCAAYFSPWKEKIHQILPNDLVFLYSNGKGIIARGIATGVVEVADYLNEDGLHPDEEYYMNLNRFEMLFNPITSSDINDIIGRKIVLAPTMVSLKYEEGLKLWQAITKEYLN